MRTSQLLGVISLTLLMAAPTLAADSSKNETSILPAERDVQSVAEAKPSVGVMIGTFIPDDGGVATRNFGVDFMIQPRIPFSFGAEITHAEPESDVTGDTLKHTNVLAKAQYNFGGTIPVIRASYLGIGAGVQIQESDTKFAAAPVAGFDILLDRENEGSHVSLGANAKYLYVEGNEDVDSNAVSLNGVVKYWF